MSRSKSEPIPFKNIYENRWTLRNFLNLVGSIFSFAAMLIAVCALLAGWNQQHEIKSIDLMSHFQTRYKKTKYYVFLSSLYTFVCGSIYRNLMKPRAN